MPDQESIRQAYFKGVRLGDFMRHRPEFRLNHTAPEFRSTISAAKAKARATGPNAWYQVTTTVGFKRGFRGTSESPSQFWDRVQQFLVDIAAALAPQQGHAQAGPLCFVRDPYGDRNAQDRGLATAEISVAEPSNVVLDFDAEAAGWEDGQYVLMLDPGNASTFDYELALIEGVQGTGVSVSASTFTKPIGTEVLRLERHLPEVALMEPVTTPVGGPADDQFVREIRLVWGGTMDPIGGDLA